MKYFLAFLLLLGAVSSASAQWDNINYTQAFVSAGPLSYWLSQEPGGNLADWNASVVTIMHANGVPSAQVVGDSVIFLDSEYVALGIGSPSASAGAYAFVDGSSGSHGVTYADAGTGFDPSGVFGHQVRAAYDPTSPLLSALELLVSKLALLAPVALGVGLIIWIWRKGLKLAGWSKT